MQTSIHIKPCVISNSEQHNLRQKELSYVRSELTKDNESWVKVDNLNSYLTNLKKEVKEKTGRAMQAKATPIREGVVVIQKDTTMEQLHNFAKDIEKKYGIKTLQIHIHKDEGHKRGKDWKPNLHAHLVFDWTQDNGKSCKLSKQDMSNIQTMLANSLNMERGKSSDIKHLNTIQFKVEAEQKRLQETQNELNELKEQNKIIAKRVQKGLLNSVSSVFGYNRAEKERNALKNELNEQEEKLQIKVKEITELNNKIEMLKYSHREEMKKQQEIITKLYNVAKNTNNALYQIWEGLREAVQAIVKCVQDTDRAFYKQEIVAIHNALGQDNREEKASIMIEQARKELPIIQQNWLKGKVSEIKMIAKQDWENLTYSKQEQNIGRKL